MEWGVKYNKLIIEEEREWLGEKRGVGVRRGRVDTDEVYFPEILQ